MSSHPAPALLLATLVFLPAKAAGDTTMTCVSGQCHDAAPQDAGTHEPYRTGDCTFCHETGPSFDAADHDLRSFIPATGPGGACRSCHREQSSRLVAGPHGTAGEGGCSPCHLGHRASFPFLLRAAYPRKSYVQFEAERYAICWDCHDSRLATAKFTDRTGFRQGRRNFHYSHLHKRKGMTCRICHDPHEGDNPFLLRSTLARVDARWSAPMLFLRSEGGGTCRGGCHKNLSYNR